MSLCLLSATGLALLLAPDPPAAAGRDGAQLPPAPPALIAAPRARPSDESGASPSSPDGLVGRAEKSAADGDLEEAIRLLDQALKADPNHRKALFVLAVVTQERGNDLDRPRSSPLFLRSAEAIRRLREVSGNLTPQESEFYGGYLYNEACTYAIEGQHEKALDVLAESVEAGFGQVDVVAADPELASIRKLPRFAGLLERAARNAQDQAAEKARTLAAETRPFPFAFSLRDPDGKTIKLADLKGDVTVVTLWGTWCAPCRREVARYEELLAREHGRGLNVVGLTYERADNPDPKKTVRDFHKKQKVTYPCLIGDDATRARIPGFQGYPTTLYLDRSATVRVKAVGECSLREMEAIVALVRQSGEGTR
jgi:thiol-disulfide isomerase/thioredoxin